MNEWRLILDPALTGPENMAVDEAVLSGVSTGDSLPTLRLYGWSAPTVSVGYLQDAGPFLESGVPVVRRITGGRAVLHDAEVTYSIAAGPGTGLFSAGIAGAYSSISGCIIMALKDIGIDAMMERGKAGGLRDASKACFHAPSRHEILVQGRKLVGSAQRRFRGAFLQHGSIIFKIDESLTEAVFGRDVTGRMASICSFSDVGVGGLRESLVRRMSEGLGASFEESGLSERERALKGALLRERYSRDEWNLTAPRSQAAGTPLDAV